MAAVSHIAPGYLFQYQTPPTSPALSINRTFVTPACFSRAPVTNPAKPAPTMRTSTSSFTDSRGDAETYGSSRRFENLPSGCRYWALPSERRRLSRSWRYRSRIFLRSSSVNAPAMPLRLCGGVGHMRVLRDTPKLCSTERWRGK